MNVLQGEVFVTGLGDSGQLGLGTRKAITQDPTLVPFQYDDHTIVQITAGIAHNSKTITVFANNNFYDMCVCSFCVKLRKSFFIWSRIYWTTWSWGEREHSFCEWREGKEGGREKRGGREGEREGGRGDREGGRERARDRREGKKSRRVDGKRDILISDLQYVSILADTDIHAEVLRNSLRSGWRVPLDIPRCKGCGLHLRQGQRLTGTWGHEDTHCASPLAGMYCVSKLYRHCDTWRYSGTPL